jgi:hypothetical protein
MKPFFALAVLIFPVVAGCQDLPRLEVLLDRLDAYANHYRATLPSLSCDELITSQALNKKGKVTRQVKVRSTPREVRTNNSFDPFTEVREFKSVDGRRPRAKFQTSQMPYFAEGGFGGLVGFKQWEQRECFDYLLNSGEGDHTVRLEMTLKLKSTNAACAKLPTGFHRIVIADPETGRVLHSERTIAPQVAVRASRVYFGGIDYAPQRLGDETFWIPSRFIAHDAESTGRMFASYSNCHRYTGELKVLHGYVLPGADQNRP